MFKTLLTSIKQHGTLVLRRIQGWLKAKTQPVTLSLALGTAQDLVRSKTELVIENALLRQHVIVLNRSAKRPCLTRTDRWLMVLLASKLQSWKQDVQIIQPDTLLRWHRDLFKWVWRRKSQRKGGKPPLAAEVIALIRQMTVENDCGVSNEFMGSC
jgi:putative transposase